MVRLGVRVSHAAPYTVGPVRLADKYSMISEKKKQANRINSLKGGETNRLRAEEAYQKNPSYCRECNDILPRKKKNNKFCSQSCAATHNNRGTRRHGKEKGFCAECGNPKAAAARRFCSKKCAGIASRYRTPQEIKARIAESSARYRAAVRNQTPPDADREGIKRFYTECPEGYEVDHIVPISKGGLHTLENLQYLTITENRRKGNRIL